MREIGDFASVRSRHRAMGLLTEARQIEEGRTSYIPIHKMHITTLTTTELYSGAICWNHLKVTTVHLTLNFTSLILDLV